MIRIMEIVGRIIENSRGKVSRALLAVVLPVLATSCGAGSSVRTDIENGGTTVHRLIDNEVVIEGGTKYYGSAETAYQVEKRCFLDVRVSKPADGEASCSFVVRYVGDDWLDIQPGRSLKLTINGRDVFLSARAEGHRERDPTGSPMTETLEYPVDQDILVRLAEAHTVWVYLSGSNGEVSGYFDEGNFTKVRRFVNDYVVSPGD